MNEPGETVTPAPSRAVPADAQQSPPPPVNLPPVLSPIPPRPAIKPAPHPLAAVATYILLVFIGGALVAPRFYATVHFLAEEHPAWREFAAQPFYRFVNRSLILLALLGLPAFFKALRIPSFAALGLRTRPRDGVFFAEGIAWGLFALATATALALSFGARTWEMRPHIFHLFWTSALAGIVVAVLEEILFRGALFGTLRRRYGFWAAALLSSAVYAIMHFFERPNNPEVIGWFSGFATLGEMLSGFVHFSSLVPGFINLTLIGLILALALERTGSLYFSIGLHASVICCVKVLGSITAPVAQANTWIWGGSKLVDGWAPGFILLAILLVLDRILPRGSSHA